MAEPDNPSTAPKRKTSSGQESQWSYDGNGLLRTLQLSGGESLEFSYDAAWRETERRLKSGVVVRQEER